MCVALALASLAAAGCFTHQCDPTSATFSGGHMIDANTYETSAYDETWIKYQHNVTLTVDFLSVTGVPRRVVDIRSSIGVSENPNDANFIEGTGNIVEISNVSPTGFQAINMTCANPDDRPYYVRFVVYFAPLGGNDAGAD
jgi:hypothetical protein